MKIGDYVTSRVVNSPTYTGVVTKLHFGDILYNGSYLNYITIMNILGDEFTDYIYCFKIDSAKIRDNKLNKLFNI